MASISCCGIWFRHRNEPGSSQPAKITDPKTQCTSPVRLPTVDEKVRLLSTRSISTSRTSASVPPTAYKTKNPNITAQGSVHNSPQQPAVSTTGEPHIKPDLWGKAMAMLPDDEKKYINQATDDASMSVPSIVEKMILIAIERRQRCENSEWKTLQFNGHEISLSDLANNTINWLNKFKEIGDVIVQYDPAHTALPWAAVRFLLQATIVTKEQMAASLIILEKVTQIIHRCQVFEAIYNRKTIGHAVVENLELALVKLYASVLRGVVQTDEFLSKPTLSRSLYSFLHPTSGSSLLAGIENGENEVGKEIMACAAQRKANIDARFQEQLRHLLELEEPILRTHENIKKVLQQLDGKELTRILQWISFIEYRTHHNTVKELRTKGTCDWLLGRPEFGQWSGATSTMTLWLQGFPGSGKTYLTSKVVEEIEAALIRKKSDESFAFFYCNRNEGDRRKALVILRSYVRQLSTTPHRPGFIHSQLKQLYTTCTLEGSGWTLGLCQEYLIKLFDLYPSTILVLDALDECEPEEREILLDFFDSIPSKTSKPVKIFISSRPEGDIRQRLIHLPRIEIQATDNEQDIAKFVKQNIERNGRWSDTLRTNQHLKREIVHTLLDQSKGMFQWAALQINQLLNLRTEPEIKNRLGKLPKGLKAAYDEIFANIENLAAPAKTLSHKALQWIMCAYEPLSSKALLPAVRVDPEEGLLEPFEPTEADLLDWCANLIRIDSQQSPPVWRVSHLSVVEYLETRWALLEAHCFVAKASLVLLSHEPYGKHEQGSRTGDIFNPRHPLQRYVGSNWIRHVQTQERRNVGVDPRLAELLKTFLGSLETPSLQYRNWRRPFFRNTSGVRSSYGNVVIQSDDILLYTSPIFLACHCSFYTLLCDWWDAIPVGLLSQLGGDITVCPLALAAAADCTSLCIKLCEAGIPVNKPDRQHGSALAAAIWAGSIEIIQLLLDKGADVNMQLQYGDYGSALAAALWEESIKALQLLLDKGADVNMQLQNGDYGSALAAAARIRSIEAVRILLNKGADVNMQLQYGEYGSALTVAIQTSSIEIMRLLLNKGADVNIQLQNGDYGSALAVAAWGGSVEIVQLLLDEGANVNMQLRYGDYGSALAAAVRTRSIKAIRLLLNRRADVNMQLQYGEYGSALAAAIWAGSIEIIQLLLDKGADVNMQLQYGAYGSTLAVAVRRRSHKIVKLLIDNGADVNMQLQYGAYSDALAVAVSRGFHEIVKLLIDNGAIIPDQGPKPIDEGPEDDTNDT